MPRYFLATTLFAFSLPLAAQTTLPPAVTAAQAAVSAQSIRAYDKYLSDDLLEGRYPGQRGGQLAAKFIASQFESYGLKPGGDNGTYFQQVDFTSVKADPIKTTFTLLPKSGAPIHLKFADDFVVFNEKLTPSVALNAPIVWVGYGITAPEFHWDDFANIDVKGKVILCLVNDPPSDDPAFFGGKALTYYGRWTYKFEQAARKGAIGALIIHRTDLAAYGWDVVRNSNISEKTFLAHDENPALEAAAWIQLDVAKQIFTASGTDFDIEFAAAGKPGFKSRELPIKLDATVVSTVRSFQSPNVIGMIPGTESGGAHSPKKDQAVIYTAHYDHLGIKTDAKPGEDNIFNGAGDNGTGTAMIMEMARAFTTAKVQPPHSIIFAAVTAEEQGLLGSCLSRPASASPHWPAQPRPELRRDPSLRPGRPPQRRRSPPHHLLPNRRSRCKTVRLPATRAAPRYRRRLLPLRPLLLRPRRRPCVLSRPGWHLQRARRSLVPRPIRQLRQERLPQRL